MKCSEARLCVEAFREDFFLPCSDKGPRDFPPLVLEASFCLSLRMGFPISYSDSMVANGVKDLGGQMSDLGPYMALLCWR